MLPENPAKAPRPASALCCGSVRPRIRIFFYSASKSARSDKTPNEMGLLRQLWAGARCVSHNPAGNPAARGGVRGPARLGPGIMTGFRRRRDCNGDTVVIVVDLS